MKLLISKSHAILQITRQHFGRLGLFKSSLPVFEHFYSPDAKAIKTLKAAGSLSTETISFDEICDSKFVAGLPKHYLNFLVQNQMKNLKQRSQSLPKNMLSGVVAWSNARSNLAGQYFSSFESEYEKQLYESVNQFVKHTSILPEFSVYQDQIFRVTLQKYLNLFSKNGLSFQELLQPPPHIDYLKPYEIVPYSAPFPSDTLLTFNPITSWTLYNLTDRYETMQLGDAYPETLHTDIVFIARNARNPHSWGSYIGSISDVPKEREVLTSRGQTMQVVEGAHMKRIIPFQAPGGIDRFKTQIVHLIYVDFIESPK